MSARMRFLAFWVALMITLLTCLAGCTAPEPTTYTKTTEMMSTYVTITVVADNPYEAEAAIDSAFAGLRTMATELSFWTKDSEIAAINNSAGKDAVKVSPQAFEVIAHALAISRNTSGAFDPTIGPLIHLWDYRSKTIPSQSSLAHALSRVDYRKVIVNAPDQTVMLNDPQMSFDTGGIAKGYGADRAVEILKARGIGSGLVAVAGDIRAFGRRADGMPWRVGIKNPRSDNPEDIIAYLDLKDEAISTSGDYERFFIKDGKRYHHIIDPKTGYPALGAMATSVIAGKAVLTDGYATGVFIMGPEKGLALLNTLHLEGLIIDAKGRPHMTQGLQRRLIWVKPEQ